MIPDKAHYDEFDSTELRFGGKWTCVHCPVQAEGRLSDGRPWYFRARHGVWSMQVGERGDEHAVEGRWVADGDDPWDGFMPAAEAAARIHSVLKWHDNPVQAAAFGCTGVGKNPLRGLDLPPHSSSARRDSDGDLWMHYPHGDATLSMSVGPGPRCTATDALAATEVRDG